MSSEKVTSGGVNYGDLDPTKILAQTEAAATAIHLLRFPFTHEMSASRGESAFVWEEKDAYRAMVIEGLGTKNLVADAMRKVTNKTYYDAIAQDTIAMIINDLIVVGADPMVLVAYWAVGNSKWLNDSARVEDLVKGWRQACDIAGVTWGGGETPALKGIVEENAIDLAGAAIGKVQNKDQLVLGDRLQAGDAILLVESSGIHANGLTDTRNLAEKLPEGFATKMDNDIMFGEALLQPTHIYASLVRSLQAANIDIHYMVNVTGHGWRKLMRAEKELQYIIDQIPEPQEVFRFIQSRTGMSDKQMYEKFNMGAGYAIFVPPSDVEKVIRAGQKQGLAIINAGRVEEGQKEVVIKPKGITYTADTLQVRR